MIYAFILLFAGGMVLGGAWSFYRSQKPWWATLALAVVGLGLIAFSIWNLRAG
uniref:hypothetical protein n=1 Tax=Brachybacterium alimentarium TaxID=47845 RepID=UPI0015F0E5C8|nr:hypothetical protein [Brachybacterium alimentarium]